MSRYYVGVDSGTTGIKAVLFDETGVEIARKGIPLTAITPTEDRYEEDMGEIGEKCCACVATVTGQVPRERIAGLGITAQGDGLWLVDSSMRPVRPGCCFCDGRASSIVARWEADGTTRRLFERTGTWLCVGNQNAIVKWFAENDRASLEASRWFLHLKDYLFYNFTHEVTTDATDQSLVFLDQRRRDYDPEAFAICGLSEWREKYPPVLPASENAFPVVDEVGEALGLPKGCLVTSGPMDVSACAMGAGVVERTDCCSIIGTAALHEMVIDRPCEDDIRAGMTVSHAMEGRWLRLMASYAGAPNTDWALRTLAAGVVLDAERQGESPFARVEQLISDVPVGSNGVMYHPYLLSGGERAPFSAPHARASYTGISSRNELPDMLHATYEGVALAMLDCYRHMPLPMGTLTVCGGGSKSALWCQMFADVLGHEVRTVRGEELGALGVALNNAVAQGHFGSYSEAVSAVVRTDRTFEPDAGRHERYERLYELFRLTREALAPVWERRTEILGGV